MGVDPMGVSHNLLPPRKFLNFELSESGFETVSGPGSCGVMDRFWANKC